MATKKDSIKSDKVTRHEHTEDPLNDPAKLIDYVSDAIISTDTNNHIHSWNRGAEKLYGWSAEEAIGKNGAELLRTRFTKALSREQLLGEMQKNGKWHGELSQRTKDNREIIVESTAIALKDTSGKPLGTVSIVHDITDRKKAEEMLRQSEERFRVAQELSPDGFLIFRPLRDSSGHVTDFLWVYENDSAARMNDTNPKEVCGKRVSEVLPNHDKSPFGKAYKEVAETGEVRVVEDGLYNQDTFRQTRWFRVIAVPTPGGDVAILVQNVTERKKAEEELKQKEHRLREAQRLARIGNWEWNLQTGEVFWSSEIYKMHGLNEGSATLTPDMLISRTHPDDLERVTTTISRAISDGTSAELDYRIVTSDGTIRVIHAIGTVTEFDKDGKPLIMVGTNQDITELTKAEQALKTSEALFHSIFNESPIGIILGDDEGRVVQSNSSIEIMLGYTKEELHGMSFKEFTYPDDLNSEMPMIAEMTAGKRKKYEIEKQYIRKDGQLIWVKMTGTAILDANGTLMALAMIEDITDLKKVQEAISSERERLFKMTDNLNVGLIIFDSHGEVIETFNKAAMSFHGFLKESDFLLHLYEYADHFDVLDENNKVIPVNEWVIPNAVQGNFLKDWEAKLVRRDNGEFYYISYSAIPLLNSAGNLTGILLQMVDITERKKAEAEFQQLFLSTRVEKERLLTVIDSIPDEVWIFDANGNVELVNSTVLKAFGSLINIKDAAKINDVSEVYEPDGKKRQAALSPPLRALKGEVVIAQEEIVRVPITGELRTRQVNASPVRDDKGNIVGAVAIVRDITDQKRLEDELKKYNETLEDNVRKRTQELQQLNEALLKSNKELESFAYITSHDLQEPLRTITSFTQLLALKYDNQLDQNAKDYIGFIVNGAKHMHELINGLLTYSRISRKELVFTEVDVNNVIEEIRANLKLLIKERNCQIESAELPVVLADKTQMLQLFQNLVENGIKFSSKDPHIIISVRKEGKNYVFSVKDEGIGIESKYYERIFEIFKRLHQRDLYPGTGIGLAICKKVVENHNGKIWVISEPGYGSTFHFTLPKGV